MDFLQKIGGRKFVMALIAAGVATYVELHTATGLSATFATFLGSLVAGFSMANYAVTRKHMDSKSGGNTAAPDLKLEQISQQIASMAQANDPELVNKLSGLLLQINDNVLEVKNVSGQLGTSVLTLGRSVQELKNRP